MTMKKHKINHSNFQLGYVCRQLTEFKFDFF